jgi:hypothetical protein
MAQAATRAWTDTISQIMGTKGGIAFLAMSGPKITMLAIYAMKEMDAQHVSMATTLVSALAGKMSYHSIGSELFKRRKNNL